MLKFKLVSGETLKRLLESARAARAAEDSVDATQLAHMFAVLGMLRPEEALMTCEIAAGFAAAELRALLGELMKRNALQAVQHVRVLIAGNTEAVS